MFNLIAYAPNPIRALRVKNILSMIQERFACRLIFIRMQTSEEEALDSSSEILYVHSKNIDQVPFLVMPRLLPDLPIYLLWGSDPTTENVLLPYFQEMATRVIFDSTMSDNLNSFAARMIDCLSNQTHPVMDFSWAQISGWRNTLLRLFNNAQRIESLLFSKKIQIVCYQSASYGVGIYLLSWLSAQLNWKFVSSKQKENILKVSFEHEKGLLEGEIISYPFGQSQEEGISSLELQTQEETIYSLIYQPLQRAIVIHTEYKNTCQLPISLPYHNQTHLIKELFHQPTGEHYCNMLKALLHFSQEEPIF